MTDVAEQQHKQRVVGVFNTIAPGYDNAALRFFVFAADRVVSELKPQPGQKVLDVATGTGAVAISCARALKPDGRVMAIDLSQAMLDKALENAKRMGLDNIDQFHMDADSLEFGKNYFHHTLCSFGLFFLPDMLKALREWVRVTRPGGKVLFTSFAKTAFKPMADIFIEQLESYGVEMNNPPFASQRLADSEVCLELLQSAGLESNHVASAQVGYHLHCIDDWWAVVWNSGMRGLVQRLDENRQNEFKQQHLAAIRSLFGEKGLWMDVEVLLSQGTVPDAN
ncbi:class I SAM-dependent methyltransferase [Kaarinaea lacus]